MNNDEALIKLSVNGKQAEQELEKLSTKAEQLGKDIQGAASKGNKALERQLKKELRSTNKEIKNVQNNTVEVNRVMKNLSGASVNDLRKTVRLLNKELSSGVYKRNSVEWELLTGKLKRAKKEMQSVRQQMDYMPKKSFFSKLTEGFNNYAGVLAGIAATIAGITLSVNKMKQSFMDQEDSQANLKALTGLDDNNINWLTDQANKLSSTMLDSGVRIKTSTNDILNAYMLVGSAQPKLLESPKALNEVTKQAMILAEAAKIDLNSAVAAVTTSLGQFNAEASDASRYTNAIAAGSKFGSANVSNLAIGITKSGVAAKRANVSIEQHIGLLETLGEKRIVDEVAGTGLKKFLLRLQTGAEETKPSVVGLNKALERLHDQQLTDAELKKKFGEEGYTVAAILIEEFESVQKYTDAVSNTNVAVDQAVTNTSTNSAKLAQIKNKLVQQAVIIGEKVMPVYISLGSTFSRVLKISTILLDFFSKHGKKVLVLTAGLIGYTVAIHANTFAQKIRVFWTNKVIKSTILQRIQDQLSAAQTKLSTMATMANAVVHDLLAKKITLATAASRIFKIAMMATPWGLIIGLVASAVTAFILFNKKVAEATLLQKTQAKIQKEAGKQYDEQASKIDLLNAQLHEEKLSLEKRREALKKLQEIVPNYHASLTEEGKLINDNKDAIDNYLTALEKKIKMQLMEDELLEMYKQKRQATKEVEKAVKVNDIAQKNKDQASSSIVYGDSGAQYLQDTESRAKKASRALEDAKKKVLDLDDAIKGIQKEYTDLDLLGKETTTPKKKKRKNTSSVEEEDDKTKQNYLSEMKQDFEEELLLLQKQHQEKKISKEEYQQSVLDRTRQFHEQRIAIALNLFGAHSKEYLAALKGRLNFERDIENDHLNKLRKLSGQKDKIWNKFILSDSDKQLAEKKEYLEKLAKIYEEGLITQEEYYKSRNSINKHYDDLRNVQNETDFQKWYKNHQKYLDLAVNTSNRLLSSVSSFLTANVDKDVSKVEKSYDRQIKSAGKNAKLAEKLEKEKQDKITAIRAEAEDKQFALKILQAISNGALGITKIWAEWGTVPPVAAALTAVESAVVGMNVATLVQQRKSAKSQYYTGGFTPGGEWDEPQGEVHSNEFVANRFATANPDVRSYLNIIDVAQKNNTISSLTSDDFQASSQGTNEMGAAAAQLAQATLLLNAATQRMNHTINSGITAVVSIEGDNGIQEQTKKWNSIQNNKNR